MSTTLGSAWFIPVQRRPQARTRLFCFPHAGGSAATFSSWASILPQDVEVVAVQLPGRSSRINEQPIADRSVLLRSLAGAFREYTDDADLAFFGHSMGAMIAFELARLLRREQLRGPNHLFVSGATAPHYPRVEPVIYHLPDREFTAALQKMDGTPTGVFEHDELKAIVLPALRADFTVVDTYVYELEAPLAIPITAFGGKQDATAPEDGVRAWRDLTTSRFTMQMFEGNHFFLKPKREVLLGMLHRQLRKTLHT